MPMNNSGNLPLQLDFCLEPSYTGGNIKKFSESFVQPDLTLQHSLIIKYSTWQVGILLNVTLRYIRGWVLVI